MIGPWEVLGETWRVNPTHFIPPWIWTLVRLWRLSQGGMGVGHLPEGPCSLDQGVLLMDVFGLLSAAEAEVRDDADAKPGVWTKRQVAEVEASIARAKELYPDGKATGALLEAVMKSRVSKDGP